MITFHFAILQAITAIAITLLMAFSIDLTADWYDIQLVNEMSLKEIFAYTLMIQIATLKTPSFKAMRKAMEEKEYREETDLLFLIIFKVLYAITILLFTFVIYLFKFIL